jgi:hypothetical protein
MVTSLFIYKQGKEVKGQINARIDETYKAQSLPFG